MAEMTELAVTSEKDLETKVWIKLLTPTTDDDVMILREIKKRIVNTREEALKAAGKFSKETVGGEMTEEFKETLRKAESLITRMVEMASEASYLGVKENGQLFLAFDADTSDPQCKRSY